MADDHTPPAGTTPCGRVRPAKLSATAEAVERATRCMPVDQGGLLVTNRPRVKAAQPVRRRTCSMSSTKGSMPLGRPGGPTVTTPSV